MSSDLSLALKAINSKQDVGPLNKETLPMFWVNKLLSYHVDCIAACYTANHKNLSPEMKFDLLYAMVRRGYRFKPRQKLDDETFAKIQLLMRYYSVSFTRATEMVKVVSNDEFKAIEGSLDIGGLVEK